ncbi:alkaline phosphatase family protein [Brevundimonas lenta]|uniref:Phospholipase C n=1 Tax=Brevundimonas lenta TaxID=424796 RepID=A0A7W6JBA7_9CAUL|nr:phospholipase C [Brevundimonas lenta]
MPIQDVEHVVVLMLENRSFDSMLGWLYEHDAPSQFIPASPGAPYRGMQNVNPDDFINTVPKSTLTAKPTRGVTGFTIPDFDPGEEFEHVNTQFYGPDTTPSGKPSMTGLLADFVGILNGQNVSPADVQRLAPTILQCFTPGQLPVLNQLAKHYAVSDAWYASVPSQTNPNRSFLMCGTSNGMVNNGDLETNPQAKEIHKLLGMAIGDDRVDAPTIFNALDTAGVDWTVFWQTSYLPQKISTLLNGLPVLIPILAASGHPVAAAAASVALAALSPYTSYLEDLTSGELGSCYTWRLYPQIKDKIPNAAQHFQKLEDFHRRARAGQLPAFSYIEPFWSISHTATDNSGLEKLVTVLGNDYHPPSNLLVGEEFVKEVYTSLISNRAAWEKTLLLITFDEFVGVFDHRKDELVEGVVTPPWGPNGQPPFKSTSDFKFDRLGARVPTILISPHVQKGTVFRSATNVPYDHTSVIATTLKWLNRTDLMPQFGQRTAAAPTFENAVTLGTLRTDEADMRFLDTPKAIGDPVGYGDSFVLKNQNGQYLTSFYTTMLAVGGGSVIPDSLMGICVDLGIAAHFPRIGGDTPATLAFITTDADPTPQIADGAQVMLVSREEGLGALNVLGAWADSSDCYYANEYLDAANVAKQRWAIQKLANQGQPLQYGDQVYLTNMSYSGQRLTRDQGWFTPAGWITTGAGGDYWTIVPAEARVGHNPWNGAPPLTMIAASQQGGSRGAQLWGVDPSGQLRSTFQETPGGAWSPWSGVWNGASPSNAISLAAAQQNDGTVRLWLLDANNALYSNAQTSPGGGWSGWSPAGWNGAPTLRSIAASQQGGSRGAQLWGIDMDGQLRSTFQETPGGPWSGWSGVWNDASPAGLISVTAAQQNDGTVRIWVVDLHNAVYSNAQTSPGGGWSGWSAAGWNNAPPLQTVAASQQGGSRSVALWGVDTSGQLRCSFQESPGGPWSSWSGVWNGASPSHIGSVAVCQQNDGTCRIWALDGNQTLYSTAQTGPGLGWNPWSPSV